MMTGDWMGGETCLSAYHQSRSSTKTLSYSPSIRPACHMDHAPFAAAHRRQGVTNILFPPARRFNVRATQLELRKIPVSGYHEIGRAPTYSAACNCSNSTSARNRSASSAAMHPVPAAVTACRYSLSITSPHANTPSTLVRVDPVSTAM